MELSQVEAIYSKDMPWGKHPIIPLGDMQIQPNRELFDERRFREVIQWGVDNDAYYLGMGDAVDFASPTNRARLRGAIVEGHLYDSTLDAIEAAAEEHLEWVKDLLAPTKGRWLGMLEGHHFWEFADGTTTDMRLANFLGCSFLGTSAYVNLRFPNTVSGKSHRQEVPQITIWAHHGRAGGKLLATPLNQLEHVVKGFDADVYLVGHHHKATAGRMSRIYPKFKPNGTCTLEHRDIYLACTGSFLKGWVEGQRRGGRPSSTYVEKGMMNPVALGHIVLWVKPHYRQQNGHGVPTVGITVEV